MPYITKREVLDAAAKRDGCLGKAADDEPVFVLVGHDFIAAAVVRDWCGRAKLVGVNQGKIEEAEQRANVMDGWRLRHGGRLAD